MTIKKLLCFIILLALVCSTRAAALDSEDALVRKQILQCDSILFERGFNECDTLAAASVIDADLEFYHDQIGVLKSRASFITSLRDNVCSSSQKVIRRLDSATSRVFVLREHGSVYGAVQQGSHRFYAVLPDKHIALQGSADFSHLWLLKNGSWRLTRVLSYNHHDTSDVASMTKLGEDSLETVTWLHSKGVPAVAIGIIHDGQVTSVRVFGDLYLNHPAPLNTLWNVASLTKPVVAFAVCKLVVQGKWSLDEPLARYYTDPDVSSDTRSKRITTRHILTQKSGFANWRRETYDGKLHFESEPGSRYGYSGEGFEYLRRALEAKFHTSLEKIVSDLVFDPAGMRDSHFYWDSSVDSTRFARWHDAEQNIYPTFHNTTANAADDLLTTMEDYTKFVAYVLKSGSDSTHLLDSICSVQTPIAKHKHIGLCWWVDEFPPEMRDSALVHGGDDVGVHTIAFILLASRDALVIFTNSDKGTSLYTDLLEAKLGQKGKKIIEIETKAEPLDKGSVCAITAQQRIDYQRYCGRYRGSHNDEILVRITDDALVLEVDKKQFKLQHELDDTFGTEGRDLHFKFVTDVTSQEQKLQVIEHNKVVEEAVKDLSPAKH